MNARPEHLRVPASSQNEEGARNGFFSYPAIANDGYQSVAENERPAKDNSHTNRRRRPLGGSQYRVNGRTCLRLSFTLCITSVGYSSAILCFVCSWAPLGDEEVPMLAEDRVQHNERGFRHDED